MGARVSVLAVAPASAHAEDGLGQPGFYTLIDAPLTADLTASVNVANGNLFVQSDDLTQDVATYDVLLSRYYNSQATTQVGGLGPRWSLSVGPDVSLTESNGVVHLTGPSRYTVDLTLQPDGTYGANGFAGSVTKAADGSYTFARDEGDTIGFDATGQMVTYVDSAGNAFTVQNTSAAGKTFLGSYGTASGQRVNLSYNGQPRVIEVDDPASRHRYYRYDSQGRLSGYVDAAGGTTEYGYDASSGLLNRIATPDGRVESITYSAGKVSTISIATPGQATYGQTFEYAAADPSVCNNPAAVGQTTVAQVPSDGAPVTYCYDASGTVVSVHDPTPDATETTIDPSDPACAPDNDGFDSRCVNPLGGDVDDADSSQGGGARSADLRDTGPTQRRYRVRINDWTTVRSFPQSYVVGEAYGQYNATTADGWFFDRLTKTRRLQPRHPLR